MAPADSTPLALMIIFLCSVVFLAKHYLHNGHLSSIDGPKGNFLVGLGLSLPQPASQNLRRWAEQYGDIYKIKIGWYHWVVLGSPEAIKEVFDKQSASCSSKMPAPMGELVVGGMRMLTMPYGPKWRTYRTLVHGLLTPKRVQSMEPIMDLEIRQLMFDLANKNFNDAAFYGHLRRALFSIMMSAVYGRRIDRVDHEDIKMSQQSGQLLGKFGKAGTFIEDEIPPLAKLPTWLQPSRRKATSHVEWILDVKMRPWNYLQQQFNNDSAPDCYGADIMRSDYAAQGLRREDCAWVAGGLVEAGSQTSSATLSNLILYLMIHPNLQEKAFQELETVIGGSRAPKADDLANLPYINACLKEIWRLCPAPPWILRHFTDADVTYKDFVIPKGTAIVINTAALHFDPSRYQDPFQFRPERYIHHKKRAAEYAAAADPYERDHFTFGAGRRICPGSQFAENAVGLALANIVWAFEIKSPNNDTGNKGIPCTTISDEHFDEAPIRSAKPFKARFVPRSEARLQIVNKTWLAMEKAQRN